MNGEMQNLSEEVSVRLVHQQGEGRIDEEALHHTAMATLLLASSCSFSGNLACPVCKERQHTKQLSCTQPFDVPNY